MKRLLVLILVAAFGCSSEPPPVPKEKMPDPIKTPVEAKDVPVKTP